VEFIRRFLLHALTKGFMRPENNNRIPLITISIDKGENAFAMGCPLEHPGSVQQSFIHHRPMPTGR